MSFTMEEGGFGTGDYVVFFVLCIASCSGGLWYSAVASRRETVADIKDYLLGGRAMSTFPVAMSLIASYVSGVTILGTPAEIYNYGTQYWLIVISVTCSCIVVAIVYLPVFCNLKLSSSYEYLELRFNRHVRALASVLFLMDEVLFLPLVVYVPALAFHQLTGFNVFLVGAIMVVICGLYTVLGGLRAVVWTDSVQTGVMFVGVILVAVAGTIAVGGFTTIIDTALESGRLDLNNWSLSFYERQTGWGVLVGGFLYWTCFNSVNQTMVQRYIALPTRRRAYCALAIFCMGAILAITLCVWCGLAAWTAWTQGGCNPAGAPIVNDRLLPAFVTYVSKTKHLPGLGGVFLAGVFGAGLSSMSAVLNACALVAVEDILRSWMNIHLKPLAEGFAARAFTAVLAIISIVMLLVVEKLGGVLGVATALSSIAASTTCGIFTLGMVCWWVGPRGAIAGAIAGAFIAGLTSFGTQTAAAQGLKAPPRNFSLGCAVNASYSFNSTVDPQTVFPLFRVSYHWIAPLGLLTTLFVGSAVGWCFDKKHAKPDSELYTPVIWSWLPEEYERGRGETRRALALRASRRDARTTSAPLILAIIPSKTERTEEATNTR